MSMQCSAALLHTRRHAHTHIHAHIHTHPLHTPSHSGTQAHTHTHKDTHLVRDAQPQQRMQQATPHPNLQRSEGEGGDLVHVGGASLPAQSFSFGLQGQQPHMALLPCSCM